MDIAERMKKYEQVTQNILTINNPVIIRVDGRAFHSFTKQMEKPFCKPLMEAMVQATIETAQQMQGFKLAYTQSDEATFMISDTDSIEAEGWFGYKLNKIISLSASIFSVSFNKHFKSDNAVFDSRAFSMPIVDVPNVFIWRQQDWNRNSLQMLARSVFSHKELMGKKNADMHEMLYSKGINWAELDNIEKNGSFIDADFNIINDKLDYDSIRDLIDKC